jgi:hypothetical protein
MTDTHSQGEAQVAVLGTGIMGSAMTRSLLAAGLRTRVWDRSPEATAPLSETGALVAASPGEAIRDAPVVITMLPTADVVESVIFGEKVAEAFAPHAVWAQMGTIGLAETTRVAGRLAELRPDVMFVDAPVSGSKGPAAHNVLERLADVGLGYVHLGQPLTTLSGGERQRLKLATHLGERGGVYVLDEPTAGLHLADVEQLLGLLDRLVDSGKSVIVIEHHQAVMAHADWIIDLGPGPGHDGGRIVFEGTPADLVAARSTLTGEHLAAYVGT